MKAELNTRENAAKAAATFCPGVASETAEAADPDVRLLVLGQLSTADRTVIKAQRVASRVRSNSASCSLRIRRAEGSDSQKDATCKGWRRSSSAKEAAAAFAVSTASGASGMTKNRWLAGQDRQSAKGSTVADRVSSAPHDEQYDLALNSSGTIADRIAASSVSPISQPQ